MKKLISLQPIIAIIIFFTVVLFMSCDDGSVVYKNTAEGKTRLKTGNCDIKVIDLDSCEYVVAQTGTLDEGLSILHKQNCKYCVGRLKKGN